MGAIEAVSLLCTNEIRGYYDLIEETPGVPVGGCPRPTLIECVHRVEHVFFGKVIRPCPSSKDSLHTHIDRVVIEVAHDDGLDSLSRVFTSDTFIYYCRSIP
jgi:hypothetical protein